MKKLLLFGAVLVMLLVAGCTGQQQNGTQQTTVTPAPLTYAKGFSMTDPAAANDTVTFTEHVNDSGQGPADYTARLTLLEVLRGTAAYDKITKSYPAYLINIQPDREFMAVHFRYELTATSKSGISRLVNRDSFAIYRDGKADPEDNKYIIGATPDLYGKAKSGDVVDGWFAFTVPKGASWPMVVYGKQSAGSGGIWFRTN